MDLLDRLLGHDHGTAALHILVCLGVPNLPDDDRQEWEHLTGRILPVERHDRPVLLAPRRVN